MDGQSSLILSADFALVVAPLTMTFPAPWMTPAWRPRQSTRATWTFLSKEEGALWGGYGPLWDNKTCICLSLWCTVSSETPSTHHITHDLFGETQQMKEAACLLSVFLTDEYILIEKQYYNWSILPVKDNKPFDCMEKWASAVLLSTMELALRIVRRLDQGELQEHLEQTSNNEEFRFLSL